MSLKSRFRRKPAARAQVARHEDNERPAQADPALVGLAIWLSLMVGVACLERLKLPDPPPMPVNPTLSLSTAF